MTRRTVVATVMLTWLSACAVWDDTRSAELRMTRGHNQAAIEQLERMAAFGKTDAMQKLGDVYNTDQFGTKNSAAAERWYRAAAQAGNGKAKPRLARLLLARGDADAEAAQLFMDAVVEGQHRALGDLAKLAIAQGRDPIRWTNMARERGFQPMADYFDAVWLSTNGRDAAKAIELYTRAIPDEPDALHGLYQLLGPSERSKLLDDVEGGRLGVGGRTFYSLARHFEDIGDTAAALKYYQLSTGERPKAWLRMVKLTVATLEASEIHRSNVRDWLDAARRSPYWIPAEALAGKLHYQGTWLRADPVVAAQSLGRVAHVHSTSAYLLAEIHRRGLLGEPNAQKARELAMVAIELGEGKAKRTLEHLDEKN